MATGEEKTGEVTGDQIDYQVEVLGQDQGKSGKWNKVEKYKRGSRISHIRDRVGVLAEADIGDGLIINVEIGLGFPAGEKFSNSEHFGNKGYI